MEEEAGQRCRQQGPWLAGDWLIHAEGQDCEPSTRLSGVKGWLRGRRLPDISCSPDTFPILDHAGDLREVCF